MTDKERIERLEAMVITLTEACIRLVSVIKTGSYEYDLNAVEHQLKVEMVSPFCDEWKPSSARRKV